MHELRRRPLAVLVSATIVVAAWGAPAAAVPPSLVLDTTTAIESVDFATEQLGNAWDWSDAADPHLVSYSTHSPQFQPANVSDGVATFPMFADSSEVTLFLSYASHSALPTTEDGRFAPIDADQFSELTFKTWSSASTNLSVRWIVDNCPDRNDDSCFGGFRIQTGLRAGTRVYHFDLLNPPPSVTTGAWSWAELQAFNRRIKELQIKVSGTGQDFTLVFDWARLTPPTAPVLGTVGDDVATNARVLFDGTPTYLIKTASFDPGATMDVPLAALPAGDYDVAAVNGSTPGPSVPFSVTPRPAPVVVDPDAAGGDDFATAVRQNPWDLSSWADIESTANANVSLSGGQLHGSSAPATGNSDPWAYLAGGDGVNARRWHRLSVTTALEGLFANGNVARLHWDPRGADAEIHQTGDDIVLWPWAETYTYDLLVQPPAKANEGGVGVQGGQTENGDYGWGGPSTIVVDNLRYDPHEDDTPRTWHFDAIRLARNDRTDPFTRQFAIRWIDRSLTAGATATISLVPTRTATSGTVLATGVPVVGGLNSFSWTWDGVTPSNGDWWVLVEITNPMNGAVGRAWSSGLLEVGPRSTFTDVPPAHQFFIEVDWLTRENATVGYPDHRTSALEPDTFRPDTTATRQSIVYYLWRLSGSPDASSVPLTFPDVSPSSPYAMAIRWAVGAGIVTGYADGTFKPATGVSRQASVAFVYRHARNVEGDPLDPTPTCVAAPFPDVPVTNSFCGEIAWGTAEGLLNGYADGTFKPATGVSRQATAAFLFRHLT